MSESSIRDDFQIGEQAHLSKTVTEADVQAFAELVGDFNPLHMDDAYAAKSRFGRRIAHGMLTAGLISAVLGMQLPGTGAIYLSQQIRFVAPVYINDTISAIAEVLSWRPDKRILTLKTNVYNQEETLVATGEAVLLIENP